MAFRQANQNMLNWLSYATKSSKPHAADAEAMEWVGCIG